MAEETAAPSQGGGGAGSLARGAPRRPDDETASPALSSEEQECRICYNPFDPEARAPKMLECLHTFCLACLKQMCRHQARRVGGGAGAGGALDVSLACPLCRHRTALSEDRLRLLPVNRKLLPPPPERLQVLPLAEASSRPILQRPLPAPGGQRRESPTRAPAAAAAACYAPEPPPPPPPSRSQEVRTVRCVCLVFTFFSLMVVSITGPLFLNYSGWVELFMVSLFLVVAIVLALFSVVPYFLPSQASTRAGPAPSGPMAGAAAAAALGRIVLSSSRS
ncbi:hypothetical protein JRQ81_017898 [Phrynocephalus forsythii]|uniref:RING-type domain-containing protein n=1 Tax=Phrynocephalus forsythii TaxID=171643 RepID=A0A9Q0XS91_9SAUR|nr:hypothetical protein JRQ81_017898 [Phrynocephalus forsythii]